MKWEPTPSGAPPPPLVLAPARASRGADGSDSITRNSAFYLLAQLSGAGFTAGLTIFLARDLTASGYGLLSLALGIAGLVALPSDFGLANAVARFVAEARDDHALAAAVLADGLRLKLIASLLVSGLLFALAPLVASAYGIHGLIWPVRGAAVFLFGQNVMLMGTAFMARGRTDLEWRTMLLESAVQTTATVALVLAGLGAAGAAFGQAIGYLAAAVLTVWLLVRLLGPAVLPRTVRFGVHTRRIATYAGVLLIVDGAYSAFSALDGLIIAAYRHTGEVAIFTAPMKLTAFLAYPAGALAAGVAPRLARSPGTEPNVGAFLVGLRVLVIVQSAITAFVLGWAPFAVSIALGSDYRASGAVLRALTPYIFLLGFGTLVSLGANYLGEARRRIPIAIATVVINVVVDLLLVPKIGALGACWGTDAAYALYAPAQLLICRRALGADLRPLVGTLARTLVAAAAMTAILLAFGSSLAHFWWPALGGLCGSAAFAAILWLSGEVSSDEVRSLLAAVPRPGRRA